MKQKIMIAALAFGLGAPAAFAIDLPFGGDALHHQLRAASDVGLVTIAGKRPGAYACTLVEGLKGSLPVDFSVAADEPSMPALRPGATYLLFLKPAGAPSRVDYRLAASIYSIQPASVRNLPAYRSAVHAYLAAAGDKGVLKASLRTLAANPVAYVQYSAVADLKHLGLIEAADLPWLTELVSAGRLGDPRARGIVARQIGRFGAREHTGLLEELVRKPGESVSVKTDALEALRAMGATASLEGLRSTIEASPALRLKMHNRAQREAKGGIS